MPKRSFKFSPEDLIKILVLALIYFISAKLGLKLAFVNASATAVWPPTGIAIASLIIFGYKYWPGIFLGAFLANLTTSGTILTSIGIATGNTLEGLVAAFLVNELAQGHNAFNKPINIFKFTFLAGLLATFISATIGVGSLFLGGLVSYYNLSSVWLTWWLGDISGALIVAPLILIWVKQPLPRWKPHKVIEALIVLLAIISISQLVFGDFTLMGVKIYEFSYLLFPLLLWVAFRFGKHETVAATFLISGIAIWDTLKGWGPFASNSPNTSLLLFQTFMAVVTISKVTVASLVTESKQIEKRLQHSLEKERELDKLKNDFIAMASHDLRSPMAATKGLLAMIFKGVYGPLSPKLAEPLENIDISTDRLLALTNDLLDISRIESGGMRLSLINTSIKQAVEEVVLNLESVAKIKGIKVVVEGAISQSVKVDADRVKQIITNLLSNAIKFTDKGSVTLRFAKEKRVLRIFCTDTGIGISEADQLKLFKKFSQIVSVERVLSRGTGLGLFISRELARKMGGDLTLVSSEVNKGSVFLLELPLAS